MTDDQSHDALVIKFNILANKYAENGVSGVSIASDLKELQQEAEKLGITGFKLTRGPITISLRDGKISIEEKFSLKHVFRAIPSNARHPHLNKATHPPILAEKLVCFFIPPKDIDPILGDMEEGLNIKQQKLGRRLASAWYWREAIRTILPYIAQDLKGIAIFGTLTKAATWLWRQL